MLKPAPADADTSLLDADVGSMARMAHRALARELEHLTLKHGVTASQWPLLRALWEEEGLTQRELARRIGVREPTITAALARMESKGIIRRPPCRGDRRSRRVFLSVTGKRLQDKLRPSVAAVSTIALADIPADDVATARRVLIAMCNNLSSGND